MTAFVIYLILRAIISFLSIIICDRLILLISWFIQLWKYRDKSLPKTGSFLSNTFELCLTISSVYNGNNPN